MIHEHIYLLMIETLPGLRFCKKFLRSYFRRHKGENYDISHVFSAYYLSATLAYKNTLSFDNFKKIFNSERRLQDAEC